MNSKIVFLVLVSAWSLNSAFAASAVSELNSSDLASVNQGGLVLNRIDVSGSRWPEVRIYVRLDCTPEEAEAVFSDYTIQPQYNPAMISAKVNQKLNPTTTDMDYALKVPIISEEDSTLRLQVGSYDQGASYRTTWSMIRSDHATSMNGSIRFEVMGKGTLLAYDSVIVPNSMFAGMLTGRMVSGLQATIVDFQGQVERERTSNQTLLQSQIEQLRSALASVAQ